MNKVTEFQAWAYGQIMNGKPIEKEFIPKLDQARQSVFTYLCQLHDHDLNHYKDTIGRIKLLILQKEQDELF